MSELTYEEGNTASQPINQLPRPHDEWRVISVRNSEEGLIVVLEDIGRTVTMTLSYDLTVREDK